MLSEFRFVRDPCLGTGSVVPTNLEELALLVGKAELKDPGLPLGMAIGHFEVRLRDSGVAEVRSWVHAECSSSHGLGLSYMDMRTGIPSRLRHSLPGCAAQIMVILRWPHAPYMRLGERGPLG